MADAQGWAGPPSKCPINVCSSRVGCWLGSPPPRVEEDPPPVRLCDGNLVRARETTREPDLIGTVERRAVELDLAASPEVGGGRAVPDHALPVGPGHRLPST